MPTRTSGGIERRNDQGLAEMMAPKELGDFGMDQSKSVDAAIVHEKGGVTVNGGLEAMGLVLLYCSDLATGERSSRPRREFSSGKPRITTIRSLGGRD